MKNLIYIVTIKILLFFSMLICISSCTTLSHKGNGNNLPPILAQDEVIRPYTTLGRIKLSVDIYVAQSPEAEVWGERALREEGARMGADAIIFPEISSRPAPHLVIPANEYRATGVAIRFK